MLLTFLQSAAVIIQHENVKILCDPWLVDGEYFGSWAQYPPYDFKPEKFDDVDYIYLSHIHPDHASPKTLSQLNKNIPVLIHKFPKKFFKNNIESLGFKVIELENNVRTHLKNNLYINIVAADFCDPEICGRYFGCHFLQKKMGTNQIDTMCVIDNQRETIVNTNDCVFPLAEFAASKIKEVYGEIDMILMGYSGASPYPHCFELTEKEKEDAVRLKKETMLNRGKKYVELFKPKYFMPFAGRYTLAGKLSIHNFKRGEPELEEAYDYYTTNTDQKKHNCVLLNPDSSFDITNGKESESYNPIDIDEKKSYIQNVLSKVKFSYEYENKPTLKEIIELIPKCYERFEDNRIQIGISSDTIILIELPENKLLLLSCNGNGYKIISSDEEKAFKKYMKMSLDYRLLKWILEGPHKAHWDNATVGSHIRFNRVPNIHDKGIQHCINFFHS